jgi:hypothetical protein
MPLSANSKIMFRMWVKTIMFSIITGFVWCLYIALERGVDAYLFNRLTATMAIFLIMLSLGLASTSYFDKRFVRFIGYRMYLGVGGFFFGLTHALLSIYFYFFVESEKPAYQFDKQWEIIGNITVPNQLAFLFGVSAILVFGLMALISMKRFIIIIGGVVWRKMLRYYGFFGLIAVLLHFLIKNFHKWININDWNNYIPPSNLILFIIGVMVLILRIRLWNNLKLKRVIQAPS